MTTSPRSPLTTRGRTAGLAALALAGSLALAGCSADDPDDPTHDPRADGTRGIDTRAYYEDYRDAYGEDYVGGAPSLQSLPDAAADSGDLPRLPDVPDLPPVPGPDEDNTFTEEGTSGFVDVADDALSTFALDIDTGSWGVAKALLADGYAVPPASIRSEEWVNALPDDDPAPTDADLGVVAESGLAPSLDDGTQLVRVGVTARDVDPDDRPRTNVTLVVDRSGSMDIRDRLGLVQSSLALLADRLDDDDTVSLVSFEDEATPLLEPTKVADTEKILEAVEDLTPGGSTNLEEGLRLGYDQARDAFDPEAVNLVVLCSDGVANVGATGPGSITEKIAEEGAEGIHLVTVGYGMGNYNDTLMEQLADTGDGFYSYVDTYAEAETLFGEELTTTLTPVAGEARTQVGFDPELVDSYRLIGYDNRDLADEDFTDMSVDAGELGAGHHATALYEVRLADGVRPGTVIGSAAVRWTPSEPGADDATGEAAVDLVAADADAGLSPTLAVPAAAADLAQLLKGKGPFADRDVTLADLRERIEPLAEDDATGADELLDLIDLADEAR